ncbi:MAG TPA: D-glycerate dehydrogenase [Bacillota bacterium]|nr:D-glycerate dehydrogenase [Bacillota bacterium]
MKPKVYITYQIPEKPLAPLHERCEVIVHEELRSLSKEELCSNLQGMDGVICMLQDRFDQEVIDCLSDVKVLANYAVGYNNIDLEYAASKGIIVTNTPGVLTNATADLAWALLFATARCIPDADRYIREGKFKGWMPQLFLGQEITGKTLGVIGAGRIGGNFAKKAKGFDMKILYYNRKRDLQLEKECGAIYVDQATLLRESDFVSLHVPLTNETSMMIGVEALKLMKPTAILINTSRGPVIDEEALVEALRSGAIWGAGLDVYENEPQVHPGLLAMKNVVLAPHIGSSTTETREKMAAMVAENVLAVLEGRPAPNRVN